VADDSERQSSIGGLPKISELAQSQVPTKSFFPITQRNLRLTRLPSAPHFPIPVIFLPALPMSPATPVTK